MNSGIFIRKFAKRNGKTIRRIEHYLGQVFFDGNVSEALSNAVKAARDEFEYDKINREVCIAPTSDNIHTFMKLDKYRSRYDGKNTIQLYRIMKDDNGIKQEFIRPAGKCLRHAIKVLEYAYG